MTPKNLSSSGESDLLITDLMCFGNLKQNRIRILWALFVAMHAVLSVTTTCANLFILMALHKKSSLHAASKFLLCTLATTDLCVGLFGHPLALTINILEMKEQWESCEYARAVMLSAVRTFCAVSLFATTAISVDRLLALLLMLRYRQVVTLRRTVAIVTTAAAVSAAFMVVSFVLDFPSQYSSIFIFSCLAISASSYFKIFFVLRRHNKTEPNQTSRNRTVSLNMASYRKTVYSALWIQLALVVCYIPHFIVETVVSRVSLTMIIITSWRITAILVLFNSSLNPILYCWKIKEVKQAVMEILEGIFRGIFC